MKKIKIALFLMVAFMLVNVFSMNVNAAEITLADIATQFNEDVKNYGSGIATICTSEQVDEGVCDKEGNLLITSIYELEESEARSTVEYHLDGNILSVYIEEDDYLCFQILIGSIGEVNNFDYNQRDLYATINSKDIFNYSVENEGIMVKDIGDIVPGTYEIKIDITKKLPVTPSKMLIVTRSGDGKYAIDDEIENEEYSSGITYQAVKESSKHVISAKADEGNKFINWTLNGEEYSTDETITITVDEDMELVANFDLDVKEIKGTEINLVVPKVGDSITKITQQDEYGEWEEQSDYPEVSTETEGLIVNAYWIKGLGELAEEPFYGTFEKDTYYYVLIDFEAEYGYELVSTFKDNITVNGVKPEELFEVEFGMWNHCIAKVKAKEVISEYKILDGDNQTYEKGKDLTIRANGNLEDLVMLKLDGNEFDASNYTLKDGSTIVTLSAKYLSTLKSGKHTLTFIYNNGTVDATFNIVINNPKTGDNMILYISLLGLSIIGLMVSVVYMNKKSTIN